MPRQQKRTWNLSAPALRISEAPLRQTNSKFARLKRYILSSRRVLFGRLLEQCSICAWIIGCRYCAVHHTKNLANQFLCVWFYGFLTEIWISDHWVIWRPDQGHARKQRDCVEGETCHDFSFKPRTFLGQWLDILRHWPLFSWKFSRTFADFELTTSNRIASVRTF